MPGKPIVNYIGKRYGRLTVIGVTETKGNNRLICRCDCGNIVSKFHFALANGNTRSCGCFKRDNARRLYSTVRSNDRVLYSVWNTMKQRCNNQNASSYKHYGGRGIKVCDEWNNYETFYYWAIANGYKKGLTIERKNYDGNYCPDNCCWITREAQARNKRNVKLYTINGVSKTVPEWCEEYHIGYHTVRTRMDKYKWGIERALTQPIQIQNHSKQRNFCVNDC